MRHAAVLALLLPCLIGLVACNQSHTDDCRDGSCTGECEGVVCEECTDAVSLRILLSDGGDAEVSVEGAALTCEPAGGQIYCGRREALDPGEHALTISAPGYQPETIYFSVGEVGTGTACCPCPPTFSRLVSLHPIGADAGT